MEKRRIRDRKKHLGSAKLVGEYTVQSARLCSMSSELGSPTPSPARECCSAPLGPKGETHSHPGEGVGGPNADDEADILVPVL